MKEDGAFMLSLDVMHKSIHSGVRYVPLPRSFKVSGDTQRKTDMST